MLDEVVEGGLVDCTSSREFGIALNNVTNKCIRMVTSLPATSSKNKQKLSAKVQQPTFAQCAALVSPQRSMHKMQANV